MGCSSDRQCPATLHRRDAKPKTYDGRSCRCRNDRPAQQMSDHNQSRTGKRSDGIKVANEHGKCAATRRSRVMPPPIPVNISSSAVITRSNPNARAF